MATAETLDDPFSGIRSGNLEVRLAIGADEVDAAQALRYRIFYEEMKAVPTAEMSARRRDHDPFDDVFDHLLVIDNDRATPFEAVVGTYRLNRRGNAARSSGFYTAGEYDLTDIERCEGEILELGRSCVAAEYRNGHTMALLWRGIAGYVFHHDITLMFGCASLAGVDPDALALPLSYLYHRHLAPEGMRPRALDHLYTKMDRIPAAQIDRQRARAALPPLIKGYLRLGGFVGDGAVIDRQFHTTDVCVVVKTDMVTAKYRQHYQSARQDPDLA
ncbi:MAG: GNAT family N-acyltransferase [Alphaproteobacteria bacterium]|jgi:putative hemolysin|nr:GNAT family N-acyltransferase [Alphaproteobacteria bacterium]MDP6518040.1 GNAT family N-acyltransferase [Alphaproteobacteria bacterium]